MTRRWFHVAKAEFLTSTSRFRGKRKIVLPAALFVGILWALFIVPMFMSALIGGFGSLLNALLMTVLPGLMCTAVMLLWVMLLIYPISSALQEIKIGQWETMLSHDVGTRSIMIGTFAAKIPVYGLLTLLRFAYSLTVCLLSSSPRYWSRLSLPSSKCH